jgi:hypothetical protein
MMARLLLLSWLPLLAATAHADTVYVNSRKFEIPANIAPDRIPLIQHVLLFVSRDKGQTWHQVGKISPADVKAELTRPGGLLFPFEAPLDCECWFRVASVNRDNQQDPIDIARAKETLVIVVDTTPPIAKLQAQRQGNEIAANWSVMDLNHERVKIEYQPKDEPGPLWQQAAVPNEVEGQVRFRPISQGSIVVRLTATDKAGNVQYAVAETQGFGGPTAVAYNAPAQEPSTIPDAIAIPISAESQAPAPSVPTPPAPAPLPTPVPQSTPAPAPPTPSEPVVAVPAPIAPAAPPLPTPAPVMPTPPARTLQAPPIPGYTSNQLPPSPAATRTFGADPRQQTLSQQAWGGAPHLPEPTLRTIASSEYTPQPIVPVQSAPPPTPAPPARKLPTLTYVNTPEVILEYEVSQIGPSGIGSVDIYCSLDDGEKWVLFVDDPNVVGKTQAGVHKRRVPLTAGDGDYWFTMLIKSKAQIKQEEESGRKAREPQPGDAPEMRVRLDTKPPIAKLFAPAPDATRPNTLLLQWSAQDENLGEAPVTLEWAETKDGPWHAIGINLANTGRHSWPIPDTLPVQVHMRLRVRDLADNESIAVTQEPLIVDLKEARGRLKSIQPLPRAPGK